jgi:hypothetical protein
MSARPRDHPTHGSQARPHRSVNQPLGRVDHPHLQRPVGAGTGQPCRPQSRLAPRRSRHHRSIGSPYRDNAWTDPWLCKCHRENRQAKTLAASGCQLDEIENRLAIADVSVCRGGLRLAKQRHSLDKAGISEEQWRDCWHAARWFLTADGDAQYPLGNGTIQVHPEQQWLELRLPAPLEHLANRPHGRYRLAAPVSFSHRKDEWAAQASSGAVRYDIKLDTAKRRWYVDASWRIKPVQPPPLEELRRQRVLGVDLNADHLACWPLDDSGNPIGQPYTIPLKLSGLPARTRDGRLRSAAADLVRLATSSGCQSIAIENLDFAEVRQIGRETLGRGRRCKRFRSIVSGIPTRRFGALITGVAANHGLGLSRWIPAGPPGGDAAIGRHH